MTDTTITGGATVTVPAEADLKALAEIISDAEITRVHGHANFGPTMTPRDVVNEGVRKYAIGYHSGYTQLCILLEHGLITKPRPGRYDANLTKKGKKYARALHQIEKAHAAVPALTARHEAPAPEDEARRKLIECIDQWDSEMEYDAEDRASLADDILHAFNGPPVVSHEAPAEGAGGLIAVLEALLAAEPVFVVNHPIQRAINALRARTSEPEASPQGEAVAWRVWSVEGVEGVFLYEDIARERAGTTCFVQPLYTHPQPAQTPGVGGGDAVEKLRAAFEAWERDEVDGPIDLLEKVGPALALVIATLKAVSAKGGEHG